MVDDMTPAASASPQPTSLDSLLTFAAYQAANTHVFPSESSLRWFYRAHRDELIKAGAVLELGGRLLVNPPIFAQMALAIGGRVAVARGERSSVQ